MGMNEAELAAYRERIGLAAWPAPDEAGLALIQRAHRRAIPFENLDIPLGRGISLDPATIFAKLVTARRGGYCFEQNALFLRALEALGFVARPLLARVWLGADAVPPRTHGFNLVTLGGNERIADAGFGGSDAPPMRLRDGETVVADGALHRLARVPEHGWMLHRNDERQYSFTTEPVWPADLELANHWTATARSSRFVQLRVVSLLSDDGLIALTGTRLSRDGGDTMLNDPAGYRAALEREFGIMLSAGEVAALGLFAG